MSSLTNSTASENPKPRLLYIDTAYTLKMVRERDLEQVYASRACAGYFEHVWGIHPIADVPEKRKLNYDGFKLHTVEFSQDQTVIEGESAYYSLLKFAPPINFLVSQIHFVAFLIGLVKRERISIIFCTDPYFGGLIGLLIKLFAGRPLVIWIVANYDDTCKATGTPAMPRLFRWRWVEKIVEKIVFGWADLVAGGNQNNLEFALNNGAIPSKSTIFPIGRILHMNHQIEPALRDKDELFITDSKTHYFIYVGRLFELKHPDDVLRAFAVIDQSVPDCALVMAGNGPMRANLEKLAQDLGIHKKVLFLGNINQRRLANLLAGCFAYLSPLTGGALVEAALAGLPIVAYDRDWQGDFIGESGAGIIVPFLDWQKMGDAAVHLLRHPEEALRMGRAARRRGLEACDLEKIYGHERREFEKLLKH